jgi:hypothetical protein
MWPVVKELAEGSASDPFDFLAHELAQQSEITLADAPYEVKIALAARDGVRAMEVMSHLEEGDRGRTLLTILSAWRAEDPKAALAWLASQPAEGLPQAADQWVGTLEGFSRRSPQEFEQWIAQLPEGNLRSQAGTILATCYATDEGNLTEARRIFQQLAGEGVSIREGQLFGKAIADRDPKAAAEFLSQLPSGRAQSRVAPGVAAAWVEQDPRAAAAWIESLPAGATRDAATGSLTKSAALVNPETAAEWVGRIGDATLRSEAAERVFKAWEPSNPGAARQWLGALDGLPNRARERILRQSR